MGFVIGAPSINHHVDIGSSSKPKISQKINFGHVRKMDKPRVAKGLFTKIITKHLMSFKDVGGKVQLPPSIPLCRLVGMQIVWSLQTSTLTSDNLKEKFEFVFYMQPTNDQGKETMVNDLF